MFGDKPLSGKLVLLAVSEPFLASYIETCLLNAGATVLGPTRTLVEALSLLDRMRQAPDGVVTAEVLAGEPTVQLCESVAARSLPLLVLDPDVHEVIGRTAPGVLKAPFAGHQVVHELSRILVAGPAAR